MARQVQERLIQCLEVIGNILSQKTPKQNSNRIPFLRTWNLTKIMQGLFPEQFFDCFNK